MSINDIFVEWQIVNRIVHCMLLYCIYSDIFVHCTALIKPVTGYRKSSSFSDKLLNCTSTFCTVAHRNMSTTRLYHRGGVNGISEMIRYHPALVQRPLFLCDWRKTDMYIWDDMGWVHHPENVILEVDLSFELGFEGLWVDLHVSELVSDGEGCAQAVLLADGAASVRVAHRPQLRQSFINTHRQNKSLRSSPSHVSSLGFIFRSSFSLLLRLNQFWFDDMMDF